MIDSTQRLLVLPRRHRTRLLSSKIGKFIVLLSVSLLFVTVSGITSAQDETTAAYNPDQTIARNWNEALLFAIRHDFARPTIHARNLFHASAAMYDSWALFSDTPSLYFLGKMQAPDNTTLSACEFTLDDRSTWQSMTNDERESAREVTLSYAQYRLLSARFSNSPGAVESQQRFDDLFHTLGHDSAVVSTDIRSSLNPATLGNYLANCIITYGLRDGSNELNDYANTQYEAVNPPLNPEISGNPGLTDANRWQSLLLDIFIDQSGNQTSIPEFLGAQWGDVDPFALMPNDVTQVSRDGDTFPVYMDPGPPAFLTDDPSTNSDYQQGHAMVALWSSHLDPADGVSWDISPASMGNITELPAEGESLFEFYKALDGGTTERGYALNPVTGLSYEEMPVPRGDFTRVLAEFWADGPDSETPPGHWFHIYNTLVSDHPDFERDYQDTGGALSDLEYDIRTYFTLGAAMHDSAIAAWSIKGAYDYIRPISALRYMASLGQSTDLSASNYHLHGIPLEEGVIETVNAGDPLAGNGGINVGKIKAHVWRGPRFIADPQTDVAGVGWILLENWWPYQRPSFVTPPFAGYVSGHSTFSRAAADVLTHLTGSEYFPGGLAQFTAKKDEFLVFEKGPSVDITLQWARYRDAADQTSLSRIWGGIHPPVDDVPGRRIGSQIAARVVERTQQYFDGEIVRAELIADPVSTGSNGASGCSIAADSARRTDETLWLFMFAGVWLLRRKQSLS